MSKLTVIRVEVGPKPEDCVVTLSNGDTLTGLTAVQASASQNSVPAVVLTALVHAQAKPVTREGLTDEVAKEIDRVLSEPRGTGRYA